MLLRLHFLVQFLYAGEVLFQLLLILVIGFLQ